MVAPGRGAPGEAGWGAYCEPVPTPAEVLASILRSDATRPRLTFYDDAEGPTRGERIELSAKVLGNWVNKAGNALQEELDAGPGVVVAIVLPVHWRAVYWALAAWSVGATVVLPGPEASATDLAAGADLLVTDDPQLAARSTGRVVLVSLPMLARSRPDTPPGAFDEADQLAGYGDVLDAWDEAAGDAPALRLGAGGEQTAYGDVVPRRDWGPGPRVSLAGSLEGVLRDALAAWALDGSVVIVRDPHGDQSARLAAEAVTLDLSRGR